MGQFYGDTHTYTSICIHYRNMKVLAVVAVLCWIGVCAQAQQCRSGWTYFHGSCYGAGGEDVDWAEAEEMCELYQSSLAEINSKAENDFLKQMAINISSHSRNIAVWLGGTDIFNEGHWEWVSSKEPVGPFTDWFPGEPNQSGTPGGEDCLQFFGAQRWQWNDEDCTNRCYFICEAESYEVIG